MNNLFKLAKLKIRAYKKQSRAESSFLGTFEAQYNPESLSITYETSLQTEPGIGRHSGRAKFTKNRQKTLNVKLVFDGTGVSDYGGANLQKRVASRIEKFLELCRKPDGSTHEPPYLKLSWGHGVFVAGYPCRLKSATINYLSFDRDGSPLHAEVEAVFVEDRNPATSNQEDGFNSPDLSHKRTVIAGQSLPMLCQEIYGSPAYYLRVAEVNGLDDFRVLTPGQELIFPPLAAPEVD